MIRCKVCGKWVSRNDLNYSDQEVIDAHFKVNHPGVAVEVAEVLI